MKYNTKLHNIKACSICGKCITQNYTIPEHNQHAEKYKTKFYNTRSRSTHGKIEHKILQYQSAIHTWENIAQNSTVSERVPYAEKYHTKVHTWKNITRNFYTLKNTTHHYNTLCSVFLFSFCYFFTTNLQYKHNIGEDNFIQQGTTK